MEIHIPIFIFMNNAFDILQLDPQTRSGAVVGPIFLSTKGLVIKLHHLAR
jgi:hypothetical protein